MFYHIARSSTRIISGLILLIVYASRATNQFQAGELGSDVLQPWGRLMIVFIGITIGVAITVEIVFHIFFSIGLAVKGSIENEEYDDAEIEETINQEMVEDEMATLINLKSMRVAYFVFALGFISSLGSIALDYPTYLMLNILFGSFYLGGMIEELARIYYYQRGI